MFEQKNSLPGAELHFSISNRNSFARPGQNCADVRSAIVAAFGRVREIVGIFRDQALEEFFEIFACSWIGVLHNNQATTCVLNKNRCGPVTHPGFVDPVLNFAGNFVSRFALRLD